MAVKQLDLDRTGMKRTEGLDEPGKREYCSYGAQEALPAAEPSCSCIPPFPEGSTITAGPLVHTYIQWTLLQCYKYDNN